MNLKRIVKLAIVLVVVAGFATIYFDLMSFTAIGSETLNPTGTPVGHALVVYDPGIWGSPRNAAVKIADDLQSKGYTVDLAGISSATARNVSGYDVIVIGGTTHWDMFGSAAKSYLQNLNASPETKIGVFATGIGKPESNDFAYMRKYITNLPDDSPVKIKSVMKLVTDFNGNYINKTGNDINKQCSDFVSKLLQ